MLLLIHITMAFGSLLTAGILYVRPSRVGLGFTYALTVAMLVTGTALLVQTPGHLVKACVMGLALLILIVYAVLNAQRKLA